MKDNLELRRKLEKLVSSENEENWWRLELFEKNTRQQIPPELEIIAAPPAEEANYNCFVYVLGLQNDPRFLGNSGWEFTRKLGSVFDEMISADILKSVDVQKSGDMVLYRASDGTISHVGLMGDANIVVSKWSWGPLIKHSIFDVPDHYGNEVEFYQFSSEAKKFVLKKSLSNYKDKKITMIEE